MKINFIVGYPRSGTTLLASMLSKLDGVIVTPETNYFRGVRLKAFKSDYEGDQVLNLFVKDKRMSDLNVDYKNVPVVESDGPDDVYSKILIKYGKDNNCTTVIEKSPLHALYLDDIIGVFPDAKIVHIVRDGRDVIASNIKEIWTYNNIYKHAAEWRDLVLLMNVQSARIVLNIRYEDLVLNPNDVIRKICLFFELNFDINNLNKQSSLFIVPDWEMKWKKKVFDYPDKDNIYKWKKQELTVRDLRIACIINESLSLYNYETLSTKFSWIGLWVKLYYSSVCYSLLKKLAKIKRLFLG